MNRRDYRTFTARLADFRCTIFGKAQTLEGEYTVKIFQVTANPPKWHAVMTPGAQLPLWEGSTPEIVQHKVEKDFLRRLAGWEQWDLRRMLTVPNGPQPTYTPVRRRAATVPLIQVKKREA